MPSLKTAVANVAALDPRLAAVIDEVGPVRYPPRSADGPFGALARSIVFQQLAGRAATAILGRVIVAAGGTLTPEGLASASDDELRAAGLSWNKIAALRDLSAKVVAGEVNLAPSARDSDDAVIAELTKIRGIGPWSAKMFLMFELRRLDVWPVEDLAIRMGFGLIFGIDPAPTAKELVGLGERFRPYRSVLARYCWVALERQREAKVAR